MKAYIQKLEEHKKAAEAKLQSMFASAKSQLAAKDKVGYNSAYSLGSH